MGARVSRLDKVPIYPGINMYIFVINAYLWEGSIGKKLDEEFFRIAENIAEDAIIVSPLKHVKFFAKDLRTLIELQLSDDRKKLGQRGIPKNLRAFLETVHILGEMVWRDGGLIILGAHPGQLTTDDVVLAIPMRCIKSNYESVEEFLTELCEFTKGNNPGFAEKFDEVDDKQKHSAIKLLDYVDLKPGIFGLALNLNAIFRSVQSKNAG